MKQLWAQRLCDGEAGPLHRLGKLLIDANYILITLKSPLSLFVLVFAVGLVWWDDFDLDSWAAFLSSAFLSHSVAFLSCFARSLSCFIASLWSFVGHTPPCWTHCLNETRFSQSASDKLHLAFRAQQTSHFQPAHPEHWKLNLEHSSQDTCSSLPVSVPFRRGEFVGTGMPLLFDSCVVSISLLWKKGWLLSGISPVSGVRLAACCRKGMVKRRESVFTLAIMTSSLGGGVGRRPSGPWYIWPTSLLICSVSKHGQYHCLYLHSHVSQLWTGEFFSRDNSQDISPSSGPFPVTIPFPLSLTSVLTADSATFPFYCLLGLQGSPCGPGTWDSFGCTSADCAGSEAAVAGDLGGT